MSIEWLIYLADVVGSIYVLFIFSGFVIGVISVGWMVEATIDHANKKFKYFYSIGISASLLLFLVAALIPSKQAIYLIAGASIAKDLAKTETAKKVEAIIESELDKLIHEGERK
jgi:hypothetical protein